VTFDLASQPDLKLTMLLQEATAGSAGRRRGMRRPA
jgi:hypothetical protein